MNLLSCSMLARSFMLGIACAFCFNFVSLSYGDELTDSVVEVLLKNAANIEEEGTVRAAAVDTLVELELTDEQRLKVSGQFAKMISNSSDTDDEFREYVAKRIRDALKGSEGSLELPEAQATELIAVTENKKLSGRLRSVAVDTLTESKVTEATQAAIVKCFLRTISNREDSDAELKAYVTKRLRDRMKKEESPPVVELSVDEKVESQAIDSMLFLLSNPVESDAARSLAAQRILACDLTADQKWDFYQRLDRLIQSSAENDRFKRSVVEWLVALRAIDTSGF